LTHFSLMIIDRSCSFSC